MKGLAAIAELLRERIGFDAETLGSRSLAHAVRGRLRARGLDDHAAYVQLLAADAAEWDALIETVVVPETWFFRDRQPFALLSRWAARWAQRDAVHPVAVLSLPCASGEEAWSIAIVLAAAGIPPRAMRVDAIDLSARSLAVARAGVYTGRALRGQPIDPAWAPYLRTGDDGRLTVSRELHRVVHFARGNLIDAPRALAGRRFDCIFSRNLLIYCTAEARVAAIAGFAELLQPEGLLILGHAETLPAGSGFVREGPPGAFAWRRGEPRKARPAVRRAVVAPRPAVAPARRKTRERVDDLTRARQLADRGQLGEAAEVIRARVASAPTDGAAHALLGIIRAALGEDAHAIEHLRRAVYLDPANEEALVHLALLLERRGERAEAARLRARARRAESAR